jgi:Ca-activated chloride channel family protein
MKTYKFFTLIVVIAMLLSACAASAKTETVKETVVVVETHVVEGETVVQEAPVSHAQPVVVATQVVQEVIVSATRFPQPTQEPFEQSPLATPADNFFQTYGVNPYEDALEDHLSTFSLDVDTASYSVARRYVNDGSLPPAEAVRVEEFVNYFEQGYPTPPEVAFGVYADGAPSPFEYNGTHLLRIGVQGYEVPEWQRKPVVLTFVIDVSGSMDLENRLGLVKQSLELLVERLTAEDTVSIVVYGSQARLVLNPTLGSDHNQILNAIYSLNPEGSTNAEAGLRMGYGKAYQAGANNRVSCARTASPTLARPARTPSWSKSVATPIPASPSPRSVSAWATSTMC